MTSKNKTPPQEDGFYFYLLGLDLDDVRPLGMTIEILYLKLVAIRRAGLDLAIGIVIFVANVRARMFGLLEIGVDLFPAFVLRAPDVEPGDLQFAHGFPLERHLPFDIDQRIESGDIYGGGVLQFNRTNIAVVQGRSAVNVHIARRAALVNVVDGRGSAFEIRRFVEGGAADKQIMRERRTAVVV